MTTPKIDLAAQGFDTSVARVHYNLPAAPLVEQAVARDEGVLAEHGALVVETGKYTGRSPADKFTVRDAQTEDQVAWGAVNKSMSPEHFAMIS